MSNCSSCDNKSFEDKPIVKVSIDRIADLIDLNKVKIKITDIKDIKKKDVNK